MKFFTNKPAVPVDLQTFRKSILNYFLVQIILIVVFLLFIHSKYINPEFSIYAVLGLILVFGVITGFFLKQCDYRGRFTDIYPDYELKPYLLVCFAFFPLIYFPFLIFLCLKRKSDKKPLKMFYQVSRFLVIAVPLLAFQISSPKIAYWIANPSTYYMVNIFNHAHEILILKEELQKSTSYKSAVDQYLQKNNGKLYSTELVLITAVTTSNVINKKKTDKSLKPIENNVKYSILVLEEMNKIIAAGEKSKTDTFDYSLTHWISPSGVVEIILLTGIEMEIIQKFKISMNDKYMGFLQNLKNGMARLPADVQAKYQTDFDNLKQSISMEQ